MIIKLIPLAMLAAGMAFGAGASEKVIDISPEHPRYFIEGKTGKTWIPIGANICFDRICKSDQSVRDNYERWLRAFAENGGNCIRLWCGHYSLEVMPVKIGEWDPEKTKTMQHIMKLCEELNIKVKITLESFRRISASRKPDPRPIDQGGDGIAAFYGDLFNRPLYVPYAKNVPEFFKSPKCRESYLLKAEYLGNTLGFANSPAMYCWELWNEINCCGSIQQWDEWARWALPELKKRFPKQLTVNNLGSFSEVTSFCKYDVLASEKDNDFMQIHRYLDLRSNHDGCKGPMDTISRSAVNELLPRTAGPVIVAEIGAVKPGHAGPSVFYPKDKEGTLLHDAIFAAFFSGAAGSGQFWHWDHQYVDGNKLWWQYRRFANAIQGIDPVKEKMRPFYTETPRLRVYGLRGERTSIIWCRDKLCDWRTELEQGKPPEVIGGGKGSLPFRDCTFECYDPWTDKWTKTEAPQLPQFKRSLVVKFPTRALDELVTR